MQHITEDPYRIAQRAMAELKAAIRAVLEVAPDKGLKNVEIGRTLGIYTGHEGHKGHIPRTLLALMEQEGLVTQDSESRRWRLRNHIDAG